MLRRERPTEEREHLLEQHGCDKQAVAPLFSLPKDVLRLLLLGYCGLRDLVRLTQVNRRLYEFIHEELPILKISFNSDSGGSKFWLPLFNRRGTVKHSEMLPQGVLPQGTYNELSRYFTYSNKIARLKELKPIDEVEACDPSFACCHSVMMGSICGLFLMSTEACAPIDPKVVCAATEGFCFLLVFYNMYSDRLTHKEAEIEREHIREFLRSPHRFKYMNTFEVKQRHAADQTPSRITMMDY